MLWRPTSTANPLTNKEAASATSAAIVELTENVSEWKRRYRGQGHVTFALESRTKALASLAPRLSMMQLSMALDEVRKVDEEQLIGAVSQC